MANVAQQLMEKIDARIIRERGLIFITLLAVVFLLWSFLLQNRFDTERKQLVLQEQQIASEQKALEGRITELTLAMASDPAIARKNEITQLNQQIADVESRLSGLSQGLISAAQLPKALEDVLQKTSSITVQQVRTLPAAELRLAAKVVPGADGTASVEEGGTGVYKHGMLIRVSGSYQQLLELMQEIEALPWRFYWESLDYQVTSYPDATIDIRVFTLSSEEGLLGV